MDKGKGEPKNTFKTLLKYPCLVLATEAFKNIDLIGGIWHTVKMFDAEGFGLGCTGVNLFMDNFKIAHKSGFHRVNTLSFP